MKMVWKMVALKSNLMTAEIKIFSTKGQAEEYIKNLDKEEFHEVELIKMIETPQGEMKEDRNHISHYDNGVKITK